MSSCLCHHGSLASQNYIVWYILFHTNWAISRENVFSRIFDQVTFKPDCSATEASSNLVTLDRASIHIILSKQRTTKVLIRLRGCAGWSAPLLFAYGLRHIFAWPGPIMVKIWHGRNLILLKNERMVFLNRWDQKMINEDSANEVIAH